MAKHLGFRQSRGHADHICENDAEKAAFDLVDDKHLRSITYIEVNDDDFSKIHDVKQDCTLVNGSIVWDSIVNDETQETAQEHAEDAIAFAIAEIEKWQQTAGAAIVSDSIKSEWNAYLAELKAIDCSSKTWPKTGTHPLEGLVGDGLTAFRHLKRLP